MRIALISVAFLVAAFIWLTGQYLPFMVASHFGRTGIANGFMPRGVYRAFMAGLALLLPLIIAFSAAPVFRIPGLRINVPHRDYWLAPARRPETIAYLVRHMAGMGVLVALLLGCTHAMVLYANTMHPPILDMRIFCACIAGFVALSMVWVGILLRHFRLP